MFQSQAIRLPQAFSTQLCASRPTGPDALGVRLLPLLTAVALVAASAWVPRATTPAAAPAGPVIVQDSDVSALRDKAEAMRAKLSALPGVAAVTLSGLQQQGLSVEYTPRRLASLGLAPAALAASVPADTARSRPGHLVLRAGAAGDLQDVANLPVHAGGRVFRLGDVALVMRMPLPGPVSTLRIDGRPAAQLGVVQVK